MRLALLIAAALSIAAPVRADCRLALALGLDVSGSVNAREYRLQLDGVAAALISPDVQAALFSVPGTHVTLAVYQWGGAHQQQMLLDWTPLERPGDAAGVARHLNASGSRFDDPATAIGAAIEFGAALLDEKPDCWRHTLDISGDGPSNAGADPGSVLHDSRLTVNGLVVNPTGRDNTDKDLTGARTLAYHYRTHVIRGPSAFIETATDFADFERAMTRKLLREVQMIAVSGLPVLPPSDQ